MKDSNSQGRALVFFLLCLAALGFNSCIGVSADISIRADGSGSIALEYRISQLLESLGRLDGNEHLPAIPVGREDFERSLARIPGLTLRSFSSRNAPDGGDLLTRATLDFTDASAMMAFLGGSVGHGSLSEENGSSRLSLTLLEPSANMINAQLSSFLQEVSAGYEINISLSVPRNATLSVIPPVPGARVVSQGRTVSFAIGTGELLALQEGLELEITW